MMVKKRLKQHPYTLSWDGKKGGVVLLGLLILGEITLFSQMFISSPNPSPEIQILEPKNQNTLEKQARSITVKIVSGEFWGSGILIAK